MCNEPKKAFNRIRFTRCRLWLIISICGCVSLLSGSCIRFHPKPITAAQTLTDFENRRLDDEALKSFLQTNQGIKEWPPGTWDLNSLTLAAFYFHPDLDVARAQWAIAQAGVKTAGATPDLNLNASAGYNSTTSSSVISPWIPAIAFDLPIEIAGKRGYRIAGAKQLSYSARLNIATVAWEVRSRLRTALLDLYSARETEILLTKQKDIQTDNVKLLESQLAAGEISPYELAQARIALDNIRLLYVDVSNQIMQARIQLAHALGLPVKAIDNIDISFDEFKQSVFDIPALEVRRQALTNRPDILGALAEYAASQSALQLEIAKQYPDIQIGAGYELDQTDNKWTLGLALQIPAFNLNRGPIAEAESRRTESAAKFNALQSRVIYDIDSAIADCNSMIEKYKVTQELLANAAKQVESAEARYRLGDISRLELLNAQLELNILTMTGLDTQVKVQQAFGKLEDAMRSPLGLTNWIEKTPQRGIGVSGKWGNGVSGKWSLLT